MMIISTSEIGEWQQNYLNSYPFKLDANIKGQGCITKLDNGLASFALRAILLLESKQLSLRL